MNDTTQSLQINIHKVDGSVATIAQSGAGLVNRILNELQPARIFNQERITIAGSHATTTFISALATRVDLINDQLSVWDFPFVIGALLELTEAEFHGFLDERQRRMQPRLPGDFPTSLEIEMVNGQRAFLWMEVIAGFPTSQLFRAYSSLKERSLVFGLRTGGIGVLNPANIVRFTIHQDPLDGPAEVWECHHDNGSNSNRLVRDLPGTADDKLPPPSSSYHSRMHFSPLKIESK
jgi:hypothetical protein